MCSSWLLLLGKSPSFSCLFYLKKNQLCSQNHNSTTTNIVFLFPIFLNIKKYTQNKIKKAKCMKQTPLRDIQPGPLHAFLPSSESFFVTIWTCLLFLYLIQGNMIHINTGKHLHFTFTMGNFKLIVSFVNRKQCLCMHTFKI